MKKVYKDSITDCPIVRGLMKTSVGDCNFSWVLNVMVYKDWIKQTMERFTRLQDHITYIYPARKRDEDWFESESNNASPLSSY